MGTDKHLLDTLEKQGGVWKEPKQTFVVAIIWLFNGFIVGFGMWVKEQDDSQLQDGKDKC